MAFQDNLIPKVPNDFVYIVLVLFIVYISTRVLQANFSHLFALIICWFVLKALYEKVDKDSSEFNKDIDYKYGIIGNPSNFYLDVNFITLFYSFYGWENLNPHNYLEAIKACNNILQIEQDSEKPLQRCVDNYQIALSQSKIALNMVHGFIFSIHDKLLIEKLKKILKRLQQLLTRHLVKIQRNCEKIENSKEKRDVTSAFIEDTDEAKPYDPHSKEFDFY